MNPIITANDTTIEIKIIDEKGCYYKTNIPNNDINKKLIENTIFKFEKSGSGIIMHDDIHVFQLDKIECNYSDYIVIQNKLENTEKEVILLKNKIDNNESLLQQKINIYYDKELNNNNDLLQQQIKILKDKHKKYKHKKEIDNLKDELIEIKTLLHQQIKLFIMSIFNF